MAVTWVSLEEEDDDDDDDDDDDVEAVAAAAVEEEVVVVVVVRGVGCRPDRVLFFGDGVFGFSRAPGRERAVSLRFCPLFCRVATRSAASEMETGEAGRFLLGPAPACWLDGMVADVGGLLSELSGSTNCSGPRASVLMMPLFRFSSLTS